MNIENISTPTLVLNKNRVLKNIEKMVVKTQKSEVRFRPHFKTHQSATIGEWFRDFGVQSITVSSIDMARYFAQSGWKDITVAFPVNIREIKKINQLANQIKLNLLVESEDSVKFLSENLKTPVRLWIKIDTGYHRTGIAWDQFQKLLKIAKIIDKSEQLTLSGLLTHSGHSYQATSKKEIKDIYNDAVSKMKQVKEKLISNGTEKVEISIGDTPCCNIVEDLSEVDEIRPGNFVFYDVMQLNIGSCTEEDLAAAVACPVVAKHEDRNEIVIYGGAVHLSKDSIIKNGKRIFGKIALPEVNGWGPIIPDSYVSSISQEHGIVKLDDDLFRQVNIGDLLMVLPVHSCLTVDLMNSFLTLEREVIPAMKSNFY
jgi:D-serine deaminase-like pyridoxal phosphate-dependent protein